jgi:hypothetical protein
VANAQILDTHGVIVFEVPRAAGHALPRIHRQQVPAPIVFRSLVQAVGRELLPLHGAIIEINAPAQLLHFFHVDAMRQWIRVDVAKKRRYFHRRRQQDQAFVERVDRPLKQPEHGAHLPTRSQPCTREMPVIVRATLC